MQDFPIAVVSPDIQMQKADCRVLLSRFVRQAVAQPLDGAFDDMSMNY